MKIIYNNIIPASGFLAMNLFGVLFVRKNLAHKLTAEVINHEAIHTAQMKELLYIGFYLWYLLEWLWRVLFTKDAFTHRAYRHIRFEKEAYMHERNLDYLSTRRHFNWV